MHSDEFKKIMMDRATLLATRFKEHVLSQRPNINQEVAFNGYTQLDEQAVEAGLVDAVVMDINEAIAAMKV
jgi:ClpP class serine protease